MRGCGFVLLNFINAAATTRKNMMKLDKNTNTRKIPFIIIF